MRGPVFALCGFLAFAFAAPQPQGNNANTAHSGNNMNGNGNNGGSSGNNDALAAKPQQCAGPNGQPCMDNAAAQRVAENFRTLITNYSNESAAAFLSPDFVDYSDGVNFLINKGCPQGPEILGQPTFTSLEDFQAGQGSQANIPFTILNVWHNCDSVTMRWMTPEPATNVQPPQPVTGIVVMEVCQNGGQEPWIISTVYSEFNSGAWLYSLGEFQPQCSN